MFHAIPTKAVTTNNLVNTPRSEYWYNYDSMTNGHRLVTVTNKVYELEDDINIMLTDQWVQAIEQDENMDVIRVEDRIGNQVFFDRTNRMVRAIHIQPNGRNLKTIYEVTYTDQGQLETYTVDEGLQNKVEHHYSTNGLLTRIDYPDGTHEGFGYDPNTFIVTDYTNRMGQAILIQPDALGRPENIFLPRLNHGIIFLWLLRGGIYY